MIAQRTKVKLIPSKKLFETEWDKGIKEGSEGGGKERRKGSKSNEQRKRGERKKGRMEGGRGERERNE